MIRRNRTVASTMGRNTEETATPRQETAVPQMGNQANINRMQVPFGGVRLPGMADRANQQETAEDMAAVQEEPVMGRSPLAELYRQLKTSKRGGFHLRHGSSQYKKVTSTLEKINSTMDSGFTQDAKENQKRLIAMEHLYEKLIQSCAVYNESHDPSTEDGKHRKELVTRIQAQASSDLVVLSAIRTDFCSLPVEEQSTKSWNELLGQARTIRLTVQDFSALGKAAGGQASEVYRLTGANTTVKNAAGEPMPLGDMHFFKPEDEYDMTKKTDKGKIVEGVLKRYPRLTKQEKNAIREWAMGGKDPEGLSEIGKTVVELIKNSLSGVETNVGTLMPRLGLDKDEKVNMTKRNVATSRVAGLLGLGHLVAKSETAELYDEATGQIFKGNLMEKAQGTMSGNDFINSEVKKRKEANMMDNKNVSVKITGDFQRDMCNLQVLDVICGQMDRHGGNFFIRTNAAGELSGLQGIDNDAAFGYNEQVTSSQKAAGDRFDRAIYNLKTKEMSLPYMDEALAERILELDPDIVRFSLKDLLKDGEIEGVIKRLEHTKTAIERTKRTQPERFLKNNDWNDNTAQAMIEQAWSKSNFKVGEEEDTIAQQNYFGNFMARTLYLNGPWAIGQGAAPQLQKRAS